MRTTWVAMLCGSLAMGSVAAHAQKTEFWMGNDAEAVHSFMEHKSKIDIISPTWYQIDGDGLVSGEPQPVLLKEIKKDHITLIPLFAIFDHVKIHALTHDDVAEAAMIASFLQQCKEYGYDGVNMDVEDVMWTDKDALSAMMKKVGDALHAEHLQLQIDVVPNAPGHAGETAFGKWIFQEWRGGYDLKALGEAVDTICLMTYDQHTHWTTPGPVGGWIWTKENMEYALKVVPKEKLSLGIALYGYRWYTGDPGLDKEKKTPNETADYISGNNAMYLRDTYGGKEQWDDADHTPWFYFYRDQMREWVFYTNERAFSDRYVLAKENKLGSVCAWVLGQEDPGVWAAIPAKR